MKKPKFENGKVVIAAIQDLAKQHGVEVTRWAAKKWDHSMALQKKLLKQKRQLESELERVTKTLKR